MTDNDIIKAFDILDKFEFFGGQRANRELWFNKPTDIQDKDIGAFLRDLDFLKDFIKSQKTEIEKLVKEREVHRNTIIENEKRFLALNLELESEIDKQYEQARADILANMADGGTSCHWCMKQHESKARKEFAERLKEEIGNLEYNARTTRKTVSIDELRNQIEWVMREVFPKTIDDLLKEMEKET